MRELGPAGAAGRCHSGRHQVWHRSVLAPSQLRSVRPVASGGGGSGEVRRPGARLQCSSGSSSSEAADEEQQQPKAAPPRAGWPAGRRRLLGTAAAAAAAAVLTGSSTGVQPAAASLLPEAVDKAWEGMGGGPGDLVFPEDFMGTWDVESVLTNVELPLGPEFVPDMLVVQRAQQQDLNSVQRYQVNFGRNSRGQVITDRRFNTASLLHAYTGATQQDMAARIAWDQDNPNNLALALPGGLEISTRVTRRSEETPSPDRLSTSEYFQQLIDAPSRPQPKVKASQCFTKYHWRPAEAAAGGPQIVATQVVSDYLTAFDDPMLMMQSKGRPIVIYTYKMAFMRAAGVALS